MPDTHGPFRNERFRLEIDGIDMAGFSSATIPENSTSEIEYREGNDPPTVRKLSSLNEYGNLSLESGTTDASYELYEWRQLVEQGQLDEARRTIAVVLLNQEGDAGARWEFRRAWPQEYSAPDLDATGNEVAIESLEIVHEGMERIEL
ncbi:phage tail protein [Natrialbaceae archaeon AArc-T1-2]|uniref:phage tail protein n=1 Tax=Natrialbaceae archaeon AArc-T1-2 TaxID=3053904 RepID=UPI00255A938E|nr:phage tail protein [Natrialbaceae archaeon AArc-T1-2]WIV66063.1 phage tail protein [Natrialbaceae archaeon AArc-T1-2]